MNFLGLWSIRGLHNRPNRRGMDSVAINNNASDGRSGTNNGGAGSMQYQLRQYAESTLGKGSLREAVILPEGEDLNEWIACHVVDFYNHINMLYMAISHHCTNESCPKMCAGEKYNYLWYDGASGGKYKEPTSMPANQYVKLLMAWIDNQLDDPAVFPVELGCPFPRDFKQSVAIPILRRMLRVYAHLYWHHYHQVRQTGLATMMNTSFNHFILFVTKYNLVKNDELMPVKDVIKSLA